VHLKIGSLAGMFTITRPSMPVKPPALSKDDAIRLWFANRQLQETNKAAVQRKEKYKASAATAARRCTELESRLNELERRATVAEARVQELSHELAKCEIQAARKAPPTPPRLLRQRLLSLVRRFHPDRTATTTSDEVTKALTGLLEELDAIFDMGSAS
jgi:uncharacterized coiled-coil protein SlyX